MNKNERALKEEWGWVPRLAFLIVGGYLAFKALIWALVWIAGQVVCR